MLEGKKVTVIRKIEGIIIDDVFKIKRITGLSLDRNLKPVVSFFASEGGKRHIRVDDIYSIA